MGDSSSMVAWVILAPWPLNFKSNIRPWTLIPSKGAIGEKSHNGKVIGLKALI